jgi:starch synthase
MVVTSEAVPFVKTGGLADVTGELPKALRDLGHRVTLVLPAYQSVDRERFRIQDAGITLKVPVGEHLESVRILKSDFVRGIPCFFIDHASSFGRPELYGTKEGDYPDNAVRFTLFARSVLELGKTLGTRPDAVHCHDWQTALIPLYLKSLYQDDVFWQGVGSLFTVHNLAYQGRFPAEHFAVTGLPGGYFRIEGIEFYGQVNFMKAGLLFADLLNTVSPRYSQEIQTEEFGCGLDGVLRRRHEQLFGIINGIDYGEWNPETDALLETHYTPKDMKGKARLKSVLQKESGLAEESRTPLFGMVSRLADMKGFDILAEAAEEFLASGAQWVVLGTGDKHYHDLFTSLQERLPGRLRVYLKFDNALAHRIYAGSDFLLMPSKFEPCGLGQLISLKYGTIPIVRETGGLADTIVDFIPPNGPGNGFSFGPHSAVDLLETIRRALRVYASAAHWRKVRQNAMKSDFSWSASAKKYVELYERLLKSR